MTKEELVEKEHGTPEQVTESIIRNCQKSLFPTWDAWQKDQLELWKKRHPGVVRYSGRANKTFEPVITGL
jgi:hypothetical protein